MTARKRVALIGAVVGCAGIACGLLTAVAVGLPKGRHYELVSPTYKGGYGINALTGVAMQGELEGDEVVFGSLGTFKGEPNNNLESSYAARRDPAEWSTTPLLPPASTWPIGALDDLTATLGTAVFEACTGQNGGTLQFGCAEALFLDRRADVAQAPFEVFGKPLARVDGKLLELRGDNGGSSDLCHLAFYTGTGHESQPLVQAAVGTETFLYELTAGDTMPGCGSEPPALRLVDLGPGEEAKVIGPNCIAFLGASDSVEGNDFNAVSADGSEIFFSADAKANAPSTECDGEFTAPGNPSILFARLNGERTIEISSPIPADCTSGPCLSAPPARAEFVGADEPGSRAFFTTGQPLVNSDTDTGKDLYMASIGCPAAEPECPSAKREVLSLTQISHDPNAGEPAEVQGEVAMSPDAGRVYFVARGVLTNTPNAEGESAIKGADNLYVYDVEEGATGFVAALCSGPELSGGPSLEAGAVTDSRCPATVSNDTKGGLHSGNDVGLWQEQFKEAQTAGLAGRYLLFTSYAQLVPGDTDTSRDVYRYDAQTGELERVSIGEAGYDANGNDDRFNAELPPREEGTLREMDELNYRAISEDGSRIVFETAAPLSPDAVSGLLEVYEWHKEPGWSEGQVSLISSGSDEEPVGERDTVAITPSGRDVFFMTVAGLLPQDGDGAVDVYDARLGPEEFPTPATGLQACSGDACQGPLSTPAPVLVPGSASQPAGEDFPPPTKKPVSKKKKKKAKHGPAKKAKRKGKARRARRAAGARRRGRGRR